MNESLKKVCEIVEAMGWEAYGPLGGFLEGGVSIRHPEKYQQEEEWDENGDGKWEKFRFDPEHDSISVDLACEALGVTYRAECCFLGQWVVTLGVDDCYQTDVADSLAAARFGALHKLALSMDQKEAAQ